MTAKRTGQPTPTLSRSVEDYLKTIYHLSRTGGIATTKHIADRLKLAAPSVSVMLKRLTVMGFTKRVPYQGAQLTRQGRHAALKTIRRHRVLEVYLTQRLGFDWDTVHDEAERLEHAASDLVIERMAAALGNPQYDPHGDPIPTADGDIEDIDLIPLASAPIGSDLELRQVDTQDPARLRFFAGHGLVPGLQLTVADRQPFGGPTTVRFRPTGSQQVVGTELAQVLLCRTGAA
jgi:DtxR family Mn-dependent transcriptional regulator